jgi:hypothetical protein
MQFIAGGNFPVVVSDGMGGQYLEGSIPLTQATGIYRAFAGGHNNMVDKLHQLVAVRRLLVFLRLATMNSASALSASIRSHKTESSGFGVDACGAESRPSTGSVS